MVDSRHHTKGLVCTPTKAETAQNVVLILFAHLSESKVSFKRNVSQYVSLLRVLIDVLLFSALITI